MQNYQSSLYLIHTCGFFTLRFLPWRLYLSHSTERERQVPFEASRKKERKEERVAGQGFVRGGGAGQGRESEARAVARWTEKVFVSSFQKEFGQGYNSC